MYYFRIEFSPVVEISASNGQNIIQETTYVRLVLSPIHHQHRTNQLEQGFRQHESRDDDTLEKYRHEAAASTTGWRSLHEEGPTQVNNN